MTLPTYRLHVAPDHVARPLFVSRFTAVEKLSGLYHWDVLARTPEAIALDQLPPTGRSATLILGSADPDAEDDDLRFVHGVVARARIDTHSMHPVGTWITLRIVPRLWRLKQRRVRRIFQDLSVREIVSVVLDAWKVPYRWEGAIPSASLRLDYCVQYDETDYEFISRIIAEAGLFFYFDHPHTSPDQSPEACVETLVFGETTQAYRPVLNRLRRPAEAFKIMSDREGTYQPQSMITTFQYEERTRPTSTRIRGFEYQTPLAYNESTAQIQPRPRPSLAHDESVPVPAPEEHGYREPLMRVDEFHVFHGIKDAEHPEVVDGRHFTASSAKNGLEQLRRKSSRAKGSSNVRNLEPGRTFSVAEGEIAAYTTKPWMLTEVRHEGEVPSVPLRAQPKTVRLELYENKFTCVPAHVAARPRRRARPICQVTESAVVVGPPGETVHTDALGRIKVQFHWDREPQWNDNASCWIRVAQPWAGAGYGVQFVPRVGMEVLVSYLAGDPDRPVVIGCLYNGTHPTPETLPDNKTRSGIRTQSTPGGNGFNELSFEDAAGGEYVRLLAQKDFVVQVKDLHSIDVGGSETRFVKSDAQSIVMGDRRALVGGDDAAQVQGDRGRFIAGSESVQVAANQVHTVQGDSVRAVRGISLANASSDDVAVVEGNQGITVRGHRIVSVGGRSRDGTEASANDVKFVDGNIYVSATAKVYLQAATEITLECGHSRIVMKPDEMTITAKDLKIIGTDKLSETGNGATVVLDGGATITGGPVVVKNGSNAELKLQDGKATLLGPDGVEIKGSSVKLNTGSGGGGSSPSSSTQDPSTTANFKVKVTVPDAQGRTLDGAKYTLIAGAVRFHEVLASSGVIEKHIPDDCKQVHLIVDQRYGDPLEWWIDVVASAPSADVARARFRLRNLGYNPGTSDDTDIDPALAAALTQFQFDHGLPRTGELDDATKRKLDEKYPGTTGV